MAQLFRSIVTKTFLLFVVILLVAVVPLALRYYQDSRDYEIQTLASKLEFFAQRGATWVDVDAATRLLRPADRRTPAYRSVLAALPRVERGVGGGNGGRLRPQADRGD